MKDRRRCRQLHRLQVCCNWPAFTGFGCGGRFAKARGDRKNAERYLNLAATSAFRERMTCVLAADLLRKSGMKVDETKRKTEFPPK